jgi:hypothetical protein
MRVAGGLMLLGSAGCGLWLAFQNRDVMIRARVGGAVWTGHLYLVLVFGALLAAWFLLGISFLARRRRPAHRRASRAARRAQAPVARQQPYSPTTQYQRSDPSLYVQHRVRAPSK